MGSIYSYQWRLPLPNEEERYQLKKMGIKIEENGRFTLSFGWNIGTRLDISEYYFILDWSSIRVIIENNRYQILNKSKDMKIELK
jgi:hypothetical protein